MTTATTGTGTMTLGSAVAGNLTFDEAGAVNSTVYYYVIEDGDDFEAGVGTYTTSGTTLSRDTVTVSKISGTAGTTKLTLSGSAQVFCSPLSAFFAQSFLLSGDLGSTVQAYDELLAEIAALSTDPNADSGLFFDDSAGNVAYFTPTNGVEFSNANLQVTSNQRTASICVQIDGGGSAITTGTKCYLEIPFACTIQQGTVLLDQTGSIVVDVWKDTYANYPPTDADSITSAAPLTVSSATKSQDATLTGWTTSISAGDILGFNVDSASTATLATISIEVLKT
jgi:hypothetical protein